jgi:hypothetical protein
MRTGVEDSERLARLLEDGTAPENFGPLFECAIGEIVTRDARGRLKIAHQR